MDLDDILASMRAAAPAGPAAAPTSAPSLMPARSEECLPDEPPPLDDCRRVAGAGASLDYRFRCGMLHIDETDAPALRADCSMAFALNSSNWLAAMAEPRCALERLARAIFARHTEGVVYNPDLSGAEWWAQVRQGAHKHEAIEFHWDVDEHFCDLPGGGGVHVHPHLSTVTYLSPVGAPTLIIDTAAPRDASAAAIAAVYGPVSSGGISFPKLGKTIVFDGSRFHGAVPACSGEGAPAGGTRVTFLVNIWLNHRPFSVEPLPKQLAASMSQLWRPHPEHGAFSQDLRPPPKLVLDGSLDTDTGDDQVQSHRLLQVAFGRNDKVHALRALLPLAPSGNEGDDTASSLSYRLAWRGRGAELTANTSGLRTNGPKKKRKR